MYRLLAAYWSAVSATFPEAWALPPDKSRLTSAAGTSGKGGADARLLVDHVRVYQRDDLAAAARARLSAWQARRSAMAAPAQGKEPARKRKPATDAGASQQPVRQVTCERNSRYGLMMCY